MLAEATEAAEEALEAAAFPAEAADLEICEGANPRAESDFSADLEATELAETADAEA
jgi:hypothetical protein